MHLRADGPHDRDRIDWLRPFAILVAVCSVVAILALAFTPSFAAVPAAPAAAPNAKAGEQKPVAEDPLGRTTPYGAVIGFLRAVDRNDYETAARFLDGKQPLKKKAALARELKIVLNRGLKIGLEDLSRAPEGRLDDELNVYLEKVGTATFGDESLDIILRRTTKLDSPAIWLFSSETLQGVSAAADQLEVGFGEAIWPAEFRDVTVLGFPLFLAINQLILLPLLWLAAWLFTRILLKLLGIFFARQREEYADAMLVRIKWPVCLLVFAGVMRVTAEEAVTVAGRIIYAKVSTVLIIVAVSWALVGLTKLVARVKIGRLQRSGIPSSIAAVELTGWLLVCLCVVSGLFLVLRSLGFEVTAAVAGLGVGGIAIAFAAQKTIENLFGTVTLVTDKPIHVGDTCQAGSTEGTVESIGLRSSRIRTVERVLVTIPNGQLASMTIGNLSHRDKFLFRHNMRLRYDTTAEQLRSILAAVRAMMSAHSDVEPANARTRLVRFGDYSFDLEVFGYVHTRQLAAFLEIQEDLLLRIMDIVDASGAARALPFQAVSEPAATAEPAMPAQTKNVAAI